MPTLRQLTAGGTLQTIRAPYAPVEGAGAGAAAAARGFEMLSETIARTGLVVQRAEEEKRKIQVAIDAEQAEARFQNTLLTGVSALQQTVSDPDAYMSSWDELVRSAKDSATGDFKYPETADAFARKLPDILRTQYAAALRHRDKLTVDGLTAKVNDTLDQRRIAVGQMDPTDEAGIAGEIRKGLTTLGTAIPVLGKTKADDLAREFTDKTLEDVAARHLQQDPAGFLTAQSSSVLYRQMDPLKRNPLVTRAEGLQKAREQEDVKAWDVYYKRIEKEAADYKKAAVNTLRMDAADGRATLEQLQKARDERIFDEHGQDYVTIRDMIVNPKDGPSDPATLQRVTIATHQYRPTMSQGQLDALVQAGKLNQKDYAQASARLTTRADHFTAEARAELSLERSILGQRQAQAEQTLRAALGIPTLFDKLEPLQEKLWADGLREMTARSRFFNGGEDPIAVGADLGQRYKPLLGQDRALKFNQIEGTLRFKTPEALEAAKNAGQITGDAYDVERRKFQDLDRIRQQNILNQLEKYAPLAPKPGSGTVPKSERPLGLVNPNG